MNLSKNGSACVLRAGGLALLLLVFLVFTWPHRALATVYTLSGRVADQLGTPLANVTVEILDSGSGYTILSELTDQSGNFAFSVNGGTYDIKVVPPPASSFGPTLILNKLVTSDSIIDILLVPVGSVSVRGHVVDPFGNPASVSFSNVTFDGVGGGTVKVDASGRFLLSVSPGNYQFRIGSSSPEPALNGLDYFLYTRSSQQFTQDTDLGDIILPAKQLDVHVQDPAGNPVPGVRILALRATNDNLSLAGFAASGSSSADRTSNAAGNSSLWLFPATYTINAYPPTGSPFNNASLSGVTLSSNNSVTITLLAPVSVRRACNRSLSAILLLSASPTSRLMA